MDTLMRVFPCVPRRLSILFSWDETNSRIFISRKGAIRRKGFLRMKLTSSRREAVDNKKPSEVSAYNRITTEKLRTWSSCSQPNAFLCVFARHIITSLREPHCFCSAIFVPIKRKRSSSTFSLSCQRLRLNT